LFQSVIAAEMMPGQLDDSALREHETSVEPGQQVGLEAPAVEALISATTLTYRSHSIAGGASAGNLEGSACPSGYTMVSGACHPGYNDRVVIINQYPNKSANTWRCGFKNNNSVSRTVWVYTLCGK
jgi:hypothetical protein